MKKITGFIFLALLILSSCKDIQNEKDGKSQDSLAAKDSLIPPENVGVSVFDPSNAPAPEQTPELMDKVSYVLGGQLGEFFKSSRVQIDLKLVMEGVKDAYDKKTKYSEEEIGKILNEHEKFMKDLYGRVEKGDTLKNFPPKMSKDLLVKSSYMIGNDFSKKMATDKLNINFESFEKGVSDIYNGFKSRFNKAELDSLDKVVQIIVAHGQKDKAMGMKKKKEDNIVKAEKFFAENRKNQGVIVADSGDQYKIVKTGKGRKPNKNETVKVHIIAKHLDGSIFDNSYEKGEPMQMAVEHTFPVFRDIFPLMNIGSKWIIWAQPTRSPGFQGVPPDFEPYEVLIFEVEMVSIVGLTSKIQPSGQAPNTMQGGPQAPRPPQGGPMRPPDDVKLPDAPKKGK